jgi:hypothetical protein
MKEEDGIVWRRAGLHGPTYPAMDSVVDLPGTNPSFQRILKAARRDGLVPTDAVVRYLQGGVATRAEEDLECNQEHKDKFGHELTVVTWRDAGSPDSSNVLSSH